MDASHRCWAALVLSVAAVAVAGCGGSSGGSSSSPSSKSTAPPATTATSSSTSTSSGTGHLAKSTPIASAAFYSFALQVATTSAPQLNARQTTFAAHCFQNGFLAAGFKLQGDLERKANLDKERGVTISCILKAESH